jgi:bifunctional DNA-binding transcriptional regulator/antitoxin component of YhaV-PrlF toxin-antitoxin module
MSTTELRETDSKGRLTLPKQFANSTLLLEVVSDVEIVLRKAKVIPLEEGEELPPLTTLKPLSDADRDLFLSVLDASPRPPTESLKKAMAATR